MVYPTPTPKTNRTGCQLFGQKDRDFRKGTEPSESANQYSVFLATVRSHAPRRMCSPLSCLSPTLHTVCLVQIIPVEITKTRYLQGDQSKVPVME